MIADGGLVRWVGSKTKALDVLFMLFGNGYDRMVIPFCGGGSDTLRAIRNRVAKEYLVSDLNAILVNAWQRISCKEDRQAVISLLREWSHGEDTTHRARYQEVKQLLESEDDIKRAAAFFYLQGTNFNGLWRENSRGVYNTPYAQPFKASLEMLELRGVVLEETPGLIIKCQDFSRTLQEARSGDLVYCDPPFIETHSTFTRAKFNEHSHEHLAKCCAEAASRGAHVFISGSNTPGTLRIYGALGAIHEINTSYSVNSDRNGRGPVKEVLIEVLS